MAVGCEMVYDLLEERAYAFQDFHKVAQPIRLDKVRTQAKFVCPEECMGYIIGRNGNFTKLLSDKYDV